MPTGVEIARDALEEFVQLQDYMLLARKENATETYSKMKDRYLTLKAILNVCGVNLTDIDKIKE